MNGLLDIDYEALIRKALEAQQPDKKSALQSGLLAAGMGMLANANRRGVEGIGAGGLMGLQAYQDNLQQQRKDPMQQIQMAQAIQGLQNSQANQRAMQDFQGFVGGAPTVAQAGPQEPVAAPMQAGGNVTREAMMRYLTSPSEKVSTMAKAWLEQNDKGGKKLKDTKTLVQDGQRVTVNFYDDGSTQVVPFAPDKEKPHYADLGGSLVALDQFTNQPLAQYQKSATPEATITDKRSRAQFTESEQRQRDQMAQQARQHAASLGQSAAQHRDSMSAPQIQMTENGPVLIDRRNATARPVRDEATGVPLESSKPPTEVQARARMFGSRMEASSEIMNKLESKGGFNPTSPLNMMAGSSGISTPMNYLASKDAQSYAQARRNWAEASLRAKSGAVITKDEIENEQKIFFPLPGDSPEIVAQKAQARVQAEAAMQAMGGKRPDKPKTSGTPSLQDVVEEMRKRGIVR